MAIPSLGKIAAVQLTGRSHLQSGLPCQDYSWGRRLKGVAAIALADGAGSRNHSDIGAQTSVRAVLRHILNSFDSVYEQVGHELPTAQVAILERVTDALSEAAAKLNKPIEEFASTLLFVGACDNRFVAGHLGDGAIVTELEGKVSVLSEPENGEYANATFFTTDRGACRKLRLYRGVFEKAGFVLMSDGAAEGLYHKESRSPAPAIQQVLAWNRKLPRSKMQRILTKNLDGPMRKSSDDLSMALLSSGSGWARSDLGDRG